MAMNTVGLTNSLFLRLVAHYRNDPPIDFVEDDDWWLREWCKIMAEEIIHHIQINARCNGLDSGADTHFNVQIT